MTLTGKDLITTLLAIVTIVYYYAVMRGFELPLISGYRGAILLLAIIGIGMCALSGTNPPASGIWAIGAGIVGATALVIVIYGLITGAKIAFLLLTIAIIALWVIATLRHILGL